MNRFKRVRGKVKNLVFMILLIILILLILFIPFSLAENLEGYSIENTGGKILSTQVWYHLDMGVQLVYFNGSNWEEGYAYGTSTRSDINTSIYFNEEIQVNDVYPLESIKGSQRYDFSGMTATDNIPAGLGVGEEAYDNYYKQYTSKLMTVTAFNSLENKATFQYSALLDTATPLEVMEYGALGRGGYLYALFGGESQLQSNQPEIYQSIHQALEQGANGTGGSSKLFLVFCPNVIEYQKFIEMDDLIANMDLPISAKQGENYQVQDTSLIGDSLIVVEAILEKSLLADAGWQVAATWSGTQPGENTGGILTDQAGEIGTVSYRLTVTGDNGQIDQVVKCIQITDGREISGTAKLNLQPVTYEGHPAWAVDESVFLVDGKSYSAARAYEEAAATSTFIPQTGSGGTVSRDNTTEARVTFPVRGIYSVKLGIELASSGTLEDTKMIEVKKTPCILDSLGGVQKQNRKQVLTAAVATRPGSPVTDFTIEVMDMETGEKITLTKEEPQKNNVTIKTRGLTTSGGQNQQVPGENDPYWTTFALEFLTKTPDYMAGQENQGQEFKYKIWVQDSKGDTDTVEKTFVVLPDMPPVPRIEIQQTFIREEGTNTAEIEMKDGTTTDGDQVERAWFVNGTPIETTAGFQDFSFLSKQHVGFEKTGVGWLNIRLGVKEKWIEPTLEEYVTGEDYKTGETTGMTEVINIAPVVSLTPIQGKEANLTIVATPDQADLLWGQLNDMKARFLENGVRPQISMVKRAPEDTGGYRQIYVKTWKSAMWCNSTCRETGPIYDSNYVYTIRSNSIVAQNYSQVCNGTHTIYAESVDGTLPNWNYTVNQASGFYIKLDNNEAYIYVILRDLGHTILLNRTNGAEVAILPVSLNGEIFLNQKNQIFVANDQEIAKYNGETGALEKVAPGGALSRLMEGRITFVGSDPSGNQGNRFYIGQFDMDQEILEGKALPELPIEGVNWTAGGKSTIMPADMDLTGKVIFIQTYSNSNQGTEQNTTAWIADSITQQVKCLPMITPILAQTYYLRGLSVGFVRDSAGEGKYLYMSYYEDENRTTTTVRWYFKLFDMKMGTVAPPTEVLVTGRQPNKYHFSGISYAKIHEGENKIYVLRGNAFQGSDWGGLLQGERMSINMPTINSTSFIRGELVTQWDVADETATDKDFLSATYYFYEQWIEPENRVKIYKNSITSSQAIENAIRKNVVDREGKNTYILTNLSGNPEEIGSAIDTICREVEEKSKTQKGIMLQTGEGITKDFVAKSGSRYLFEYEILTSPAGVSGEKISRVFYPFADSGANQKNTRETVYKETAAQLDFTNPSSVARNSFYTWSASCYLEGRGGLGSGYYGKSGQSKSYSFTVNQHMEKDGYTEFDLFTYFGYQATGAWSITVDGQLYDTNLGVVDEDKTIFLKAGQHQLVFSGWITSGYYGYMGISSIQTIYYDNWNGNNFMEKISGGEGWNQGGGTFVSPPEPLFKRSSETKTNMRGETFQGNVVNISEYIRFEDNGICFWSYNGTGAYAAMGSTYQTYATGNFSVSAPWNKHLIVSFTEEVYMARFAPSNGMTGGSKVIGNNTIFVEAGQSFYRNYNLQRGRSGGYGSVKVSKIKIIEVPSTILADGIYGENGAAKLKIGTRTTPFYTVNFLAPESNQYSWTSFTDLYVAGLVEKKAISLVPTGGGVNGATLLKNLKIFEMIENYKMLVMNENLDNGEHLIEAAWSSIPTGGAMVIKEVVDQEEEAPSMVYKKGELVALAIDYSDFENDPTRRQYWKYYHVAMNDGGNPIATLLGRDGELVPSNPVAPVLDAPVERFYIDGKYVVEHWQEDNTARNIIPLDGNGYPAGNPDYDKLSNVETITFYVDGTWEAPWIKSIETGWLPDAGSTPPGFLVAGVKEGEDFALQIMVDDLEKDKLQLKTEVYKEGNLVYTHFKDEIQAIEGVYPPIITGGVGVATPGKYQVISTVRDETGAGLGTLRFTVIAQGKITGTVSHTEGWEIKRKQYNLKHKVDDDPEKPRGSNLFWPGEAFVLKAEVGGEASIVTGEILGYENEYGGAKYGGSMVASGYKNNKGEWIYEGQIWEDSMMKAWAKKGPVPLTIRFTAIYGEYVLGPGGTIEPGREAVVKFHEVQVVVDDREPYLILHRVW